MCLRQKMEKWFFFIIIIIIIVSHTLKKKIETLPLPSPKAATCIWYKAFLKVLTV